MALLDAIEALTCRDPATVSPEALDAAGRLAADTLICAAAGAPLTRSVAHRALAAAEGGRPEARVFGTCHAIPARLAAAVNVEAANLLDADDTFFNVAHFGALIAAVALAEGERLGQSWDAVRGAIALGFDLNARLALAVRAEPGFHAPGLMALGAALAAASLSGATAYQARAAIGLAARFAPMAVTRKTALDHLTTIKYAPYGVLAAGAIHAARLAMAGYRSPTAFLDEEPGFLAGQRAILVRPDLLGDRPGAGWWVEDSAFKLFPSVRVGQFSVQAMWEIAGRTGFDASAIETIEVALDPRARLLPFHGRPYPLEAAPIDLPIAASMSLRLSIALAALQIPPGPRWCDPAILGSDPVRDLYERVHLAAQAARDPDAFEALRDPTIGLIRDGIGCCRGIAGRERQARGVGPGGRSLASRSSAGLGVAVAKGALLSQPRGVGRPDRDAARRPAASDVSDPVARVGPASR
jgi:2-methylcitrate dehydratase PrpD